MKFNFQRKILRNGITLLFEKREIPVASVAFAIRAGGVNELPSEKGISHFIEHMLYKGTSKRNAKQIAEEIENTGGELNGFTSEEITAYWCKMPSQYLHVALDVLSDMIQNPLFNEKEMEKEKKVIFEEIKMYHDNPTMYVTDEIQKSLYNGTMKINLAGTFESMNSITKEKMLKKFHEIYKPNNMILCVVGDADFNKLAEFVEENFGNEKGKIPQVKFDLVNESKIESRKDVDQANLMFAFHVPDAEDKKSYAAIVLNSLMADGMSSRLFAEIREKRNLAYAVKGTSNINKKFAYNLIYVGTMKENVEEVKKLILEEFRKVAKELKEKEFEIAKKKLIGNYQISMEDSQEQMINLLSSEIHGTADDFYKFEKDISEVKLEDVKNLAKKATEQFSFFALVPE